MYVHRLFTAGLLGLSVDKASDSPHLEHSRAVPVLALVSFPSATSVLFLVLSPVPSPSLRNLEVPPLSFKQSVLSYAYSP